MVHLNKHQLTKQQLSSLFDQLSNTLGALSTQNTAAFMTELLGYEERIMLAKRLAIIVLLLEGQSLYRISRSVKVSPATAETIKRQLEAGGYKNIVATLGKSKKDYTKILTAIDSILHLGGILPHYNGLDRYKQLRP